MVQSPAARRVPALPAAARPPSPAFMSSSSKEVGRFFKHSSIYAVGNVLNRVGAFLLLPIYTRLLSTGEYGALETLYMVSGIVSGILGVGISHATLRFYFEYKEPADRKAVVSTNLIASLAISVAGVLLVSLASGWLSTQLFQGIHIGAAFNWMLATIVFELASQIGLAYIRAVERSMLFIVVSFIKLLVQVVANSLALMYFKAGVEGVMIGNFLTVAFGFVLLSGVAVKHCGLRFEWAKLMPVLRYSFPFLLTMLVSIVGGTSDRFLLQTFMSLEALGVYALALKFSKLISDLVGEPVNRAYGSFRFTIMERADAGLIQAHVFRYLAVLLTIAALAVVLFTSDVLRLMATPAYWPAARYLPVLVLAAVLQVLVYPLQTGIFYQKQSGQLFYIALAQTAVATLGGLVLIWVWGIWGACLTTLAVSIITVVMTNRISQRYFKVHYEHLKLLALFLLAAAVTAAGYAADQYLATLATIGVKLLLIILFMAGLVLTRVINSEEITAAKRMIERRLGRRPATASP